MTIINMADNLCRTDLQQICYLLDFKKKSTCYQLSARLCQYQRFLQYNIQGEVPEHLKKKNTEKIIIGLGKMLGKYKDIQKNNPRFNSAYRRWFSGYHSKKDVLDDESRRLCLPDQQPSIPQIPKGETGLRQGPLGRRNLLKRRSSAPSSFSTGEQPEQDRTAPETTPSPASHPTRQQRTMSDLSALQILDFIIHREQASIPTAVIFIHAEDLSRHSFQGTASVNFRTGW
ncbi:MAG: hypothetical protein GY749_03400 [Desulfobacteraceae bacterium]|nr:hypothetical protein [Desulfobacteraceae bacterium]